MNKLALSLALLAFAGCTKIGPRNLHDDTMYYNHAVHSGNDRQMLLNIVRLHYRDNPTFLQVGIISSAYEFKRAAAVDGKFDFITEDDNHLKGFSATPKVGIEYNEKPTFTLSPLRGEGFSKEMLSHVSPAHLMLLHTSGWKIDRILRTIVSKMNNVKNAPTANGPTPQSAPQYANFVELAKLLRGLELSDELYIVSQRDAASNRVGYYMIFDKTAEHKPEVRRVRELLELAPDAMKVQLIPYHGKEHGPYEVMIDTRSPLSILYFLSQNVDVPVGDQIAGRVTLTTDEEGNTFDWNGPLDGIMKVHYAPDRDCLCNASVAVCYRGKIFYIDDSDLNSKSTFQMLTQLLALQISSPEVPVITLPLQ